MKGRLARAAGLLAIVLIAQTVSAQQSRTAVLQGAVVTMATGEPIANAAVELRALDGSSRLYSNSSQRDGSFVFRNVPPGRYQLTAMRPGYVRGDFGLRGPGASGTPITLTAGQRLADVRLSMRATGTIAGRVTDTAGDPVGNVHVKALRFAYQDGTIALVDVKSVFTNDLGEYRLGFLPPGLYNVSALHPDALGNPLNLPETINSAPIVGTVVTNAGGMNGGSFGSTGSPDPAVRSRLGLQPGEDYVPVYFPGTFDQRAATAIEVRSGSEAGAVDFVVAPIRTATISGVVRLPTFTGRPPRITIQVSRNPSYTMRTQSVSVDPETGSFQIAGLAPGSFALAVSFPNEGLAGHAIVEVPEGGEPVVQVTPQSGVGIPVHISVAGAPAGIDLTRLLVGLRSDPAIPGLADISSRRPQADGTLLLSGVVPGDYIVNVSPLMTLGRVTPVNAPPAVPGVVVGPDSSPSRASAAAGPAGLQGAYVKSIRFGGNELPDGRLRVDGGSPGAALEIVIAANAGQFEGAVLDARARPAAYVTVVLVPDTTALRHRVDLYKVTPTDAAGRFRVQNIPPGDYKAFAWEDVETGAWFDFQFTRLHEGRGATVRIAEGARASANLTAIPAR